MRLLLGPRRRRRRRRKGGWRCEEEEADLISPFFPPSLIMPCFCSNVETTPEVKTELNLTETKTWAKKERKWRRTVFSADKCSLVRETPRVNRWCNAVSETSICRYRTSFNPPPVLLWQHIGLILLERHVNKKNKQNNIPSITRMLMFT